MTLATSLVWRFVALKESIPNLKYPIHHVVDLVEHVDLVVHEKKAGSGQSHPTFFEAPHFPASTAAPTTSSNLAPTLNLSGLLVGFSWVPHGVLFLADELWHDLHL